MKKIEAIIRPENLEAVKAALVDAGHSGINVLEAKGHGTQQGVVTFVGDGKVFVSEVETGMRVRTGERGTDAIENETSGRHRRPLVFIEMPGWPSHRSRCPSLRARLGGFWPSERYPLGRTPRVYQELMPGPPKAVPLHVLPTHGQDCRLATMDTPYEPNKRISRLGSLHLSSRRNPDLDCQRVTPVSVRKKKIPRCPKRLSQRGERRSQALFG
ncbi:MAG: hypothetical protein Kow0067_17530 [Coriobacteriia bacterium]